MTIPGSSPFASAPYGATPVVPVIGPEGGPYNVQGPRSVVLLPSAARTATTVTPVQVSLGYRGVYLSLTVTVNPGGAQTLTVGLAGVDTLTLGGFTLLSVPASATPGGVSLLYPGASGVTVEGVTTTRNLVLPDQWYVQITHSGVGAWTYSLTGILLP